MKVLLVAAEARPAAHAGDLGEVVSALAKALREEGCDVRCALPRYGGTKLPDGARENFRVDTRFPMNGRSTPAHVSLVESDVFPAPMLLVDHGLFERRGIYEDPLTGVAFADDGMRWAAFGRALHDAVGRDGWIPDVVHAHDHPAAPFAALVRWRWRRPQHRPAIVFTIHDMAFPGLQDRSWIAESGLPPELDYPMGPLEFHGRVNLMKLGIEAADRLATVSASYALELRFDPEAGAGLEGVLARHADSLDAIPHGVDAARWNPAVDRALVFRYTRDVDEFKGRNASALRDEFGLDVLEPEAPLAGFVGRFAAAGGLELLLPVVDALLEDGVRMVFLGSGDGAGEDALRDAAARRRDRVAVRFGWDEGVAHRVLAGSDLLLFPSRREPSGLRARLGMAYGAVPVARATGGLADVVVDEGVEPFAGNGFLFHAYQQIELLRTVRRAVRARRDRAAWRGIVERGMTPGASWGDAARAYVACYSRAVEASR